MISKTFLISKVVLSSANGTDDLQSRAFVNDDDRALVRHLSPSHVHAKISKQTTFYDHHSYFSHLVSSH